MGPFFKIFMSLSESDNTQEQELNCFAHHGFLLKSFKLWISPYKKRAVSSSMPSYASCHYSLV